MFYFTCMFLFECVCVKHFVSYFWKYSQIFKYQVVKNKSKESHLPIHISFPARLPLRLFNTVTQIQQRKFYCYVITLIPNETTYERLIVDHNIIVLIPAPGNICVVYLVTSGLQTHTVTLIWPHKETQPQTCFLPTLCEELFCENRYLHYLSIYYPMSITKKGFMSFRM